MSNQSQDFICSCCKKEVGELYSASEYKDFEPKNTPEEEKLRLKRNIFALKNVDKWFCLTCFESGISHTRVKF